MIGARADAQRLAELDRSLREMLQAVCALPVPSRIASVVEQLEDVHDVAPRLRARQGR